MRIEVDLPLPPSVNRIWRVGRTSAGKPTVYREKKYKNWLKTADGFWLTQRAQKPFKSLPGEFTAEITIFSATKRRIDIDNRAKAVLDWAQRVGLIVNDSLCQQVTTRFGTKDECPMGCRLILTEHKM